MKLLPTIADRAASQARKPPDAGQGRAALGENQPRFDDVLLDYGTSTAEPSSKYLPPSNSPMMASPAKLTATVIDLTVDLVNSVPATPDAPVTGASKLALQLADSLTGSVDSTAPHDDSPEKDDGGTQTSSSDSQAPMKPLNVFLLPATVAGSGVDVTQGSPIAPRSTASTAAVGENPTGVPGTAPQAPETSGAARLVFDISVVSQPAPAASRSVHLAPIELASMAEAFSGTTGVQGKAAGTGTSASFREPVQPPTAEASNPQAVAIAIVSPVPIGQHDSSTPPPATHHMRDAVADDPSSRDEGSSLAGDTAPALPETPAHGMPTQALSPPLPHVAEALARTAAETAAPAAAQVPEIATARPMLARTLTLQISPNDRGTIAIKMHAIGGSLDVSLTASDPRTAGLLTRERDTLANVLQDSGTTLQSLVIQDGSGAPQPGGHHASRGDTSGATPHGEHRGNDAATNGNGHRRREQAESQARREGIEDGKRGGVQTGVGGPQAIGGVRSLLV